MKDEINYNDYIIDKRTQFYAIYNLLYYIIHLLYLYNMTRRKCR